MVHGGYYKKITRALQFIPDWQINVILAQYGLYLVENNDRSNPGSTALSDLLIVPNNITINS